MNMQLLKRMVAIRSVPSHIVVITALVSYLAQLLAIVQGWPLWVIVLVTLIPWLPLLTREMVWTYRHYNWLALYYLLVITQGGHFIEHLVQVIQIHALGMPGHEASGIFGALDIEWVHFVFNSWVLLAVALLLWRFRRNPWLWLTLIVAIWHEAEHVYIMSIYLATGIERTPGLLAQGGLIGGGLPISRVDLHFWYNVLETVPLMAGFIYQLRQSYDEWLTYAFPHVSPELLAETTNLLQMLRLPAGETIVRQGDLADRFYIITEGQVSVTCQEEDGRKLSLAELGPGQFFGEIGLLSQVPRMATVKAKTAVELLAIDRDHFRYLVDSSAATADDLARVAQQRLAQAP